MKYLILFLVGCGQLPEISEYSTSDIEITGVGSDESIRSVVVYNKESRTRIGHLKCFNTSQLPRYVQSYEFDLVVGPLKERRFMAEYPIKYKHLKMCSVVWREMR